MSDVLFDFNKFTLKPEAREKLAKVSGILLAYPNLKVQLRLHRQVGTRNTTRRFPNSEAMRARLLVPSVSAANLCDRLRMSNPIADNSTNAGRGKTAGFRCVSAAQSAFSKPSLSDESAQAAPQGGWSLRRYQQPAHSFARQEW